MVWRRTGGVLMMVKLIGKMMGVMLCLMILWAGNAFAFLKNGDSSLYNDMYNNPQNYILVGHQNDGISYYINRNSICVNRYSPPEYIISFDIVGYTCRSEETGEFIDKMNVSYKYDYSSRKMYRKSVGTDNKWEYVEAVPLTDSMIKQRKMSGSVQRTYYSKITEGEIAFYLAYGISFFDQPVTEMSKDFIVKGVSEIQGNMSPLKGTYKNDIYGYGDYVYYVYNHKENRFEVWRRIYKKGVGGYIDERIK